MAMTNKNRVQSFVDVDGLPAKFPTHGHSADFWECLGRAVATFGFLEEILGKAIFAFTATRPYDNEAEAQRDYEAWLPKLERALRDPLGRLIEEYGKAVREHPGRTITNPEGLLNELRKAGEWRNVLCHCSWGPPTADGASVPSFVNRRMFAFDRAVDVQILERVQCATAELACAVVNTVTQMGWQFPGLLGPGKKIWDGESP
jgi:hypothetical protein